MIRFAVDKYFILKLLLIYAIVVDSVNGYFQEFANIHLPIGIVFRGMILLYMIYKGCLLFKSSLGTAVRIVLFVFVISLFYWLAFEPNFMLGIEVQQLFKLVYFFCVVFYIAFHIREYELQNVLRIVYKASLLNALLILFCFFTDQGIKSYGESFGFGTKAFYADGNSIGLYLTMCFAFSFYYVLSSHKIINYLGLIVSFFGIVCIGSRTAILGSIGVVFAIMLHIFLMKKYKKYMTAFFIKIVVGVTMVVTSFFLINLANNMDDVFDNFTQDRYTSSSLLNPRSELINQGKIIISSLKGGETIVGKSMSAASKELADIMLFPSQNKLIEADFYDMIMCYGWGLGLALYLIHLYLILYICSFFSFRYNRRLLFFVISLSALIWLIESFMAGHGIFNVMSAPILGICYGISLHKKIFYEESTL